MKFHPIVLAVLLATGCYSPRFKNEIACDPAGACPPGTTCGPDGKCHAPGTGNALIDAPAGVLDIDAPVVIDARPVGCAADPDCMTPPDLCSKPGTCDLSKHECVFPAVDCSAMNDECNLGTCEAATGNCIKASANGGIICGAGNVCGAFGPCGGFDTVCDSSGTQTRPCTQNTCQAGICTAHAFSDTQACSRGTDGVSCGATTVTACYACSYAGVCSESGSQACTCTDRVCASDGCTAVSRSCTQTCTRDTEGKACTGCVNFRIKFCLRGQCSDTSDC